ncbi:MFS transporter [Sphingomonas sp. MG17]|uniref:MFS transporter n=1 Tax=Sphingomonas tagetis TaxID=2949092 RepID=A0A9X2HRE8_9SPHN|nr:MFS transporter [Sphingomonas tagetis]MCP3732138.1 MFS transporter [Sphingomonas tagetis]
MNTISGPTPSPDSNPASEWRHHGTLPFAAAFGCSISVLQMYAMGPFIEPLQQEFGWSRTEITTGAALSGLVGAAMSVPVGMLVDRVGVRKVGLAGVVLSPLAFGLLSTASGTMTNWLLLWSVIALAALLSQPTVWTKAVASRFERSRGLALAVTLSGTSVGATVYPLLGSWLIESYGWRTAFWGLAAIWVAIVLAVVLPWFRSAPHARSEEATDSLMVVEGFSVAEGLRSLSFYKLVGASGLFMFGLMGLMVHFVPILSERGVDRMSAASTASLVGIFSIVGRLATGLLLDRFPGRVVGSCIFTMPIIASLLLLSGGAGGTVNNVVAAIFLGLTVGAEVDVIAFLCARYMGLKSFGVLFGAMVGALSLGAALGPLIAGAFYDQFGSYALFLIVTMAISAATGIAIATLGEPRFGRSAPQPPAR